MNSIENEVKKKWGETQAYREYSEKTSSCSKSELDSIAEGLDMIMKDFSVCMTQGKTADSIEAQNLVAKLKCYITENFYNCTDEILSGLGKMYTSDERFRENIDRYAANTAEYISEAIGYYCSKQ